MDDKSNANVIFFFKKIKYTDFMYTKVIINFYRSSCKWNTSMRLNLEDGESEDTSEHGNHDGIQASLLTQTSW